MIAIEQSLLTRLQQLGLDQRLEWREGAWELLSDNPSEKPVRLDFNRQLTQLRPTLTSFREQPLFRALGRHGGARPKVWDVTCGLGGDSLLLLLFGCEVVSSERHPIPALMLLRAYESFTHEIKARWQLALDGGDPSGQVDVIYFDPMYNGPESSALPRKEMRIFRDVVGEDEDAQKVAEELRAKGKRLVIKRPPKSAPLLGAPSVQQEGKAVRFDVYLPRN